MEELNGTFVIKRTSLRLESGVCPMGMMRSVYFGEPVPVISTSRFRHWRGVETMLKEYAAARDARGARAARAGRMRGAGIVSRGRRLRECGGKDDELRGDG